jgi:hypothetical protein
MSDTPETDAQLTTFTSISKLKKHFVNRTGTVSADFARKLERELRTARDKCHQQRMIRLAGDKVYAEMCHEAEEQARLLAMSADREERLRSQIAALKSQISNLQSP